MPVPGAPWDDLLLPHLEAARAALAPGVPLFDTHTHTGQHDPDGVTGTAEELLEGMDRAGIARAVVFTTAEPDGYPPANDRVLAEAAASDGRLVPFCRIDPNAGDPRPEAERCLAAGVRGFKLHPRSDAFVLSHPSVQALVALAEERGVPVLFHAGRGIPALGSDLVDLARRHPGAPLILAHAGISDLSVVGPAARELPNVRFDSSWWQVSDLLALYALVDPAQILFASDMPYGSGRFAVFAFLRCAREVGLADAALAGIAGGNVDRMLAGEPPVDLGPAPGRDTLGSRWLAGERIVAYTSAAVQMAFRGGDPTEPLALARLACQVPTGGAEGPEPELLGVVDELLAHAQEILEQGPEVPRVVAYPALAAQVIAGTPRVPV
jgi:predicted TIM-barrel fold metal-dependent hydrolase